MALTDYSIDTSDPTGQGGPIAGPNSIRRRQALADAGPAFLGKAQGAALNSDEGRSVMMGSLKARDEGTNQRIIGDVNRALGPAEDPQTVTNAIRQHRTNVDSAAYPAALDNAPAVRTAPILICFPPRRGPLVNPSYPSQALDLSFRLLPE